jgi:hypothetical protein
VAEFKKIMKGLEAQKAAIDQRVETSKSTGARFRRELLEKIMEMLREAGVDTTDPTSVKNFTDSLEERDPDTADLLDYMLSILAPMLNENKESYEQPGNDIRSQPDELEPPAGPEVDEPGPTPGAEPATDAELQETQEAGGIS